MDRNVIVARRALLSLSDRDGAEELARALRASGYDLVATGGTRAFLSSRGIDARDVEELTDCPPLFGGRVKTLHPNVLGAILFDRNSPEHRDEAARRNIAAIDVVVVTLYPPPEIDIGGVALLRAAAKNYAHVSVLSDPSQYGEFIAALASGEPSLEFRERLAAATLELTSSYDAGNARRLRHPERALSGTDRGAAEHRLAFSLPLHSALRYGENPQQRGAFYAPAGDLVPEQLHGKALSYNNLLDLDATLRLLSRSRPAVDDAGVRAAVVKHTIPCGVAERASVADAVVEALDADRISAYGGIVATDMPIDGLAAQRLAEVFLEIVAAPDFDDAALSILRNRRNLRVMRFSRSLPRRLATERTLRSALGGVLVEEPDPKAEPEAIHVVSRREPSATEWRDLEFAWDIVRHVKSNGIVVARNRVTRGICAGQTNRVSAVRIAARRAGERARGASCASDGFFPFADGLDAAIAAGCSAVIAPGGSIRDEEVIAAADRAGIALVFSSHRYFLH
jgi:phosphoribosylaminoimidazolecarboxamide formyltransferase / IMP cyclohydrolase